MDKRQYLLEFNLDDSFEEEYLNNIPVLKYLKEFIFNAPVTFFIGENGSGKSTLIEALAVCCGFNPEGGTKNFNFSTKETHSSLHKYMNISRNYNFPQDGFFLRAESFYNVATEIEVLNEIGIYGKDISNNFLKNNYGGISMHKQSHGESFVSLIQNRFKEKSIFFLDEPEAALSPIRQMTLLRSIHELVDKNCQFIIATHSPIIMSYPDAEIVEITSKSAKITPYRETEHYIVTRDFLNNPDRNLNQLFSN